MEKDEASNTFDVELEDGEISDNSDNIYTPLQRPATLSSSPVVNASTAQASSPLADCHQMQKALEEEEEDSLNGDVSSSSESSVDNLITQRKRPKSRRTVMVRVPANELEQKRARFKKYDVWTHALQEESLTENMRGCDMARNGLDRNVENYDFSLQYRLNGENSLKRRLSNSTDELSESEACPLKKRGRTSRTSDEGSRRRSVKSRLGYRRQGSGTRNSSPTSGSDNNSPCVPRHIVDLQETAGREPCDIAREMSKKLYEKKDELLVRAVEVLGIDLPIELFKETQRIEADGGMMIKNGTRRRTPGGVFLFLLKHHHSLTLEDQNSIFKEEQKSYTKWHKEMKSLSRDRKVEELKKRLSKQERELSALNTRKDLVLLGSDLSVENNTANLSNPPPSPVTHHDRSPEYKAHAINVVGTEVNSIKASTSTSTESTVPKELTSYEDDFLDVNCAEMDLF